MVSKGALLRNIRPSGGLFTENILLRLRDNPNQLKIGKIDTFLEEHTKVARKKLTEKKQIIFEWCIQKWDEISPNIEEWSIEDLEKKWLIPLFTLFDHEIEDFEMYKENLDGDSILKEFRISYQSKDHKNPFFYFVSVNEDFDSNIDNNPQKKSHHSLCQQFINFNPEIKWLFLSNGRILRILTNYYHSYSKGYLEFDLENIFANRDEREFDTLYSIIHRSRFIPDYEDHKFLIDVFQKESVSEGLKIGDALRYNIHKALVLLGDELIQQDPKFQDMVLANEIDIQEYYAELLRIIYRIIFILYAEQREMLPGVGTLYFEQFSLSSFRFLAEKPIKAEKNYDLWKKLFLTFQLVNEGNEFLGVNSYNGNLFKNENLSLIFNNELKLSNGILLRVIRKLTTSKINNVLQRVNFLEVSEEEIGAIYESLLDFKPYIPSTSQFQLIEGTERKSTGSYYTPKALIDILIKTTLQPLVEDRLIKAGDDRHARESAILDLKVCDPACGGGTFLLSTLDYLGKKLAEVRTSSDSPLEDDLREARREILQHCIYGVDMNPLAVELAKISLWLRACVKDKPLNFLDNHIKCGNSLVGLGQKMEIKEINPNAFKAISGSNATGIPTENTKLQNQARNYIKKEIKERKKEGKTTMITSFFTDKRTADVCSIKFQEIINMPENNPEKIIEKEKKYYKLRKNENYQQALNEANIWTSTFFWAFKGNALGEIPRYTTIEHLREKIADQELNSLMREINKIAEGNQFFHWYIEFPEVFSSERGGFDCILTNPPWETYEFKEREYFMDVNQKIFNAPKQSERRKLIKELKEKNFDLFKDYSEDWKKIKKTTNFYNNSNLYNLSSKGTINTYALFIERCQRIIKEKGRSGLIVPTGFINNFYLQYLFKYLIKTNSLISLFDFQNRKMLFQIADRFRFCLLTLTLKQIEQKTIPMSFYSFYPSEIQKVLEEISNYQLNIDIPNDSKLIFFESSDFKLFNPNTLTAPVFFSQRDYSLTRKIYRESDILIEKDINTGEIIKNPWNITFKSNLFHMSGDSKLLLSIENLEKLDIKPNDEDYIGGIWENKAGNEFLPCYEGKMIWLYDHRYNSVIISKTGYQHAPSKVTPSQYEDLNFFPIPYYWVEKEEVEKRIPEEYLKNWLFVFRGVTNSANERTFVSTIIPRFAAVHSLAVIFSDIDPKLLCCLIANLNSFVLDYILKQKFTSGFLSIYIVEQLPIFSPSIYNKKLVDEISCKVLELIYTSNSLANFALDCGFNNKPFEWNQERRFKIMAELDAIYAHLYNLEKKELEYILDFFIVLKENELKEFNEYKTRRLVLEAYDKYSKHKELFE